MAIKRSSNEEGISGIVKRIMVTSNLQSGIDKVDAAQAWKDMMGNGVNSYTNDVILKNGTLFVQLTSSVLREELIFGKDKIIKILNEHLSREVVTNVVLK